MAYPDTDVILLCYSVARPTSMENIVNKWIPEINKFIPSAQIVLVGTQVDLRDNNTGNTVPNDPSMTRFISTKEGEELKHRIKAYKFIECSAFTQLNIKEVFDTCVDAYVNHNQQIEPPCSCFQSLFKRLRNTISRRLSFRRRSSTNSNGRFSTSSNKEKHFHES